MTKRKKTLQEYRENGRKIPLIPYLFDRTFPYVAAIFALVAITSSYIFIKDGLDSLNRIQSDPQEVSPYQNIKAVNSPGMEWGSQLIKIKPPKTKNWEGTETTKPQHAIDPKVCSYITDIPTSLLSTYVSSGSGIETRVQVYGAGQAAKNFNSYITALESCTSVEIANTKTAGVAKYDDNFIMTMGDAIVSVSTPNDKTRDELLDFYIDKTETTLKDSQCLALDETEKDANRSFFYSEKEYVGLKESKELETTINIDNLPTPTSTKILKINNEYTSEPESPLPKEFPKIPSKTEKPNLPKEITEKTAFEGTAIYKIMDENGPGCGWKWSAQTMPQYNEDVILKDKKETIDSKQKEINDKALKYVTDKLEWSFSVGLTAPKIDEWNTYVNKVNKVHKKWNWLNDEREALRSPWYNYVNAHKDWETFDDRKEKATKEYDRKLEECKAKQDDLDDWEEKWGNMDEENNDEKKAQEDEEKAQDNNDLVAPNDPLDPHSPDDSEDNTESPEPTETPDPTPTKTDPPKDIPKKPEGCSSLPQRPAIMGQQEPEEPKAPKIPKGVTIPDNWPKV